MLCGHLADASGMVLKRLCFAQLLRLIGVIFLDSCERTTPMEGLQSGIGSHRSCPKVRKSGENDVRKVCNDCSDKKIFINLND